VPEAQALEEIFSAESALLAALRAAHRLVAAGFSRTPEVRLEGGQYYGKQLLRDSRDPAVWSGADSSGVERRCHVGILAVAVSDDQTRAVEARVERDALRSSKRWDRQPEVDDCEIRSRPLTISSPPFFLFCGGLQTILGA